VTEVLIVVCLILTVVAMGLGIMVLNALKGLEKKLSSVEKQLTGLQSDVDAAEKKISALQAQMRPQPVADNSVHPLIPVLVSILGGNSHRWLPIVATTGLQVAKTLKARRAQQKSQAKGVKALPEKTGTE